jgi:hypothetical protein
MRGCPPWPAGWRTCAGSRGSGSQRCWRPGAQGASTARSCARSGPPRSRRAFPSVCLDQHGGDFPRGWSNVSCRRRTFRARLARLTLHLRSGCRRSAWRPDRDADVRWPDVLPDGGRVVGLVHLHVVHLAGLVDGGGTRDLPHLALIIDDEITGSELTRKDAEPLPVGGRRR